MICPACGRENVTDGLFCSYCAAKLPVREISAADEFDDEKTVIIKDEDLDDLIDDEKTVIINDEDTYVPSFRYQRNEAETYDEKMPPANSNNNSASQSDQRSKAGDDVQLRRLQQLYDDGILTESEYKRKLSSLSGNIGYSNQSNHINHSQAPYSQEPAVIMPAAEPLENRADAEPVIKRPQVQKFCAGCGAPLAEGMSFCTSCGAKTGNTNTTEDKKSNDVSLFDSLQNNIQSKLGVEDNRQITHEYQKLGGWLAFIAYGNLVGAILMVLYLIVSLSKLSAMNSMTAGLGSSIIGPIAIMQFIEYAILIILSIKLFLMIQKKDTGFLNFYETVTLLNMGIIIIAAIMFGMYTQSMLGVFSSYVFGRIIGSVVGILIFVAIGFGIWLSYFSKSVRVRTYFGTDEYLKKSIFCKNVTPPEPAVPDRH